MRKAKTKKRRRRRGENHAALCLWLRRGCGVRAWGPTAWERGRREGDARARRALFAGSASHPLELRLELPERIEQAKSDWQNARFPKVPGDVLEFTPLPQGA